MGQLLIAVSLLLLSAFLWIWHRFNDWFYLPLPANASKDAAQIPPGSMGWPVIGETLDFLWCFKEDPQAFFKKSFAKYNSPVCRSHLLGSPCIMTAAADFNKFVLTTNSVFHSGWSTIQLKGQASIGSLEGEHHRRIKRFLLDTITHPIAVKKFLVKRNRLTKSLLQNWACKGTIALLEETRHAVFHSICHIFLSLNPGESMDNIHKELNQFILGFRAFPMNLPGFAYFKGVQSRKKLRAIIQSMIDSRRGKGASVTQGDLLDDIMNATDPRSGDKLSDEEIFDNLNLMLVGAQETTGYTMMWAMILLAKNPAALQKLRDEHSSIQRNKKEDEDVSPDDIKLMRYTHLVIKEILRITTFSTVLLRHTVKDVQYKGFLFPKGWKVVVFAGSHYMNSTYFAEPHKFNPERFENFAHQPGIYEPFGYGARICPGNQFTEVGMCLFLHHLALNYRWELVNPDAKITYLPGPLPIDGAKVNFYHI